jgi:5'-3' exonuclease
MIIVDFSQVVLSGIQVNLGNDAKTDNPNAKGLIKHMILNFFLSFKKKFGKEYGDIVLAMDGRNYWRKSVFPHYKAGRAKAREKSALDWEFIFNTINEIKAELRENFLYKIVEVEGAEADDVIATLVKYYQTNELVNTGLIEEPQPIMIISSDGDFVQLQKYGNVKQWTPMKKKLVKPEGKVEHYIIEHICTAGDDGIPNICSADNCFVDGIRQTSFRKARLPEFFTKGIDACKDETERRNYQRNQILIDFDYIPDHINKKIIDAYTGYTIAGSKNKIMNYMIKNKMKLLMEHIGEF